MDDSSTKIQQMSNIEHTLLEDMEQKARELRNESEREAIISGALILLVLGVSLVGAFVVARSMIRSLRRLEETATKVAQDRLPELVKQLSESDPQDVDTSVESVGVHSRDEIGQVAAAFDDVHREAVRLAAEQALLRGNVNAMFTNLSRRSQGLIQRQLSLISELESREADPDQLSSLFKLDHLATRMRRNGENLLVLAGEEPGRRWTRPVPLVDVLRAAASEVEQYERIELASVPTTEVAGRVVNDLVHLLAELLENATSFSSPQTKVKVTGHALPDGRVLIEIHDTGIGLSPEDLAAINERLASPPTVDVSVSRRMGLFVVGRLSQRHGIRIQLRPSDSGGTTALVMLPVDVAQGGRKPQPKQPGQAPVPVAAVPPPRRPPPVRPRPGVPPAPARAAVPSGPRAGGAVGGGALGAGAPGGGRLGAGQGPRAALPGRDAWRWPSGCAGRCARTAGSRRVAVRRVAASQGRPARGRFRCVRSAGAGRPAGPAGSRVPRHGSAGRGHPRPAGPGRLRRWPEPEEAGRQPAEQGKGRRPQLPPRGGPRAELPGGDAQPRRAELERRERPAAGAARLAGRPARPRGAGRLPHPPVPRIDDRQGPGATTEMPAVPRDNDRQGLGSPADFGAAQQAGPVRPRRERSAGPGPVRPPGRLRRPGRPPGPVVHVGQYPAQQSYDNGSTGQYPAPQSYDNGSTGQYPAPRQDNGSTGQYRRPARTTAPGGPPSPVRPRRPARRASSSGRSPTVAGARPTGPRVRPPADRPVRQEPEALPPASGPGDGRTPLYDTLETNWFHGAAGTAAAAEQRLRSGRPAAAAGTPRPSAAVRRSSSPRPAGVARRTTISSGRPSESASPPRAVSPPPACRAGCPGRTSSRVRLSSKRTRAVRRSRVRLTTCAAG